MAVISLDNKTYLSCALTFAKKSMITKSLGLLGKCDSYEGHINRIVLLLLRGDFAVANKELISTYAQYNKRYNVYPDVYAIMSRYDVSCLDYVTIKYKTTPVASKKSIAECDVVVIDQEELEPISEIFEEEIDFFELADLLNGHRMFDIKSTEYLNFLKYKAYLLYAQDKQQEANTLIEKILDTNTDDQEILMWKIMVLCNVQEYDKAMKIAEKIYDKIADIVQLGYIAECICQGCGNKDMLRVVMDKILLGLEQCSSDRIVKLMRICNDYIVDYQMAGRFAQFLLSQYQYFPIDSLRDAVWVFLHCGDIASAKQATTALLRSVPDDVWANAVLQILPLIDASTVTAYASSIPPITVASCALPRVVSHTLVKQMASMPSFDKHTMQLLRGIVSHCNVLARDNALSNTLIDGIRYQIEQTILDASNIDIWAQFVSDGLLWALYPMDIAVLSLMRLVDYGYTQPLHINLGEKMYPLDTACLAGVSNDQQLLNVICILCLLDKMTAKKLAKYIEYYQENKGVNYYDTALMLAERAGITVKKNALEEIIEIQKTLNNEHTI